MRRVAAFTLTGTVALFAAAAVAGTIVETNGTDWGSYAAINLDLPGPTLELSSLINQSGSWIRHPWDGVRWRAELEKNTDTMFSQGDRCYTDSANPFFVSNPTGDVNGEQYRAGTALVRYPPTWYLASVPPSTIVPLPVALTSVSEVRFLTGGARIADTPYTVRFHYVDLSTADVGPITVLEDESPLSRTNTAPAEWDSYNWGPALVSVADNGFDEDSNGVSDCAGNGADEIHVLNPQPGNALAGIEFLYTGYGDAGSATGWLGGPLAVSVVSDEPTMEATFAYYGYVESPSVIPGALDAGSFASWTQVAWNEVITDNSDVLLYFTCGDDDNPADNVLTDGTELALPETVVSLANDSSPFMLSCAGQYMRYRLEFFAEFNNNPTVNDLTFTFDPDADGDGHGASTDCDDSDPFTFPGALEIVGDEKDQSCDGKETCWRDQDNDGARSNVSTIVSEYNVNCTEFREAREDADIDCADGDPGRFPNNPEVIGDGIDQDCDNVDDCYQDGDQDGVGGAVIVTGQGLTCQTGFFESSTTGDCDDADPGRFLGNPEVDGDGIDQNCDDRERCFTDGDDDGAILATTFLTSPGDHNCTDAFEGQIGDPLDCNDSTALISPFATETPGDSIDQDCDNREFCYTDNDDDGARLTTSAITALGDTDCTDAFEGETADPIDCNDAAPAIRPGVPEQPGDSVDQNCDTVEDCFVDDDNDGALLDGVSIITTNPGDTDCLGAQEGELGDPIDCNDSDPAIRPSVAELPGDSVDQNCDNRELCFVDDDNDGARLTTQFATPIGDIDCTEPFEGELLDPIDCDDIDPLIFPGASELPGDNVDQNCDGVEVCFVDNDDDGARTSAVFTGNNDADCDEAGEAIFTDPLDCNDSDPAIKPGEPELPGDNIDQNCDNRESCFDDVDNDGDRSTGTFSTGSGDTDCTGNNEGELTDPIDCNDINPLIWSGATEITGDSVDQNCDTREECFDDQDDDGDRWTTIFTTLPGDTNCTEPFEGEATDVVDCDDLDPQRFSANTEVIGNGKDNDCDLQEECWRDNDGDNARNTSNTIISADEDCDDEFEAYDVQEPDCDDSDPTQFPSNVETTGNEVDNDCDGEETCWADLDLDDHRDTVAVVFSSTDEDCRDPGEAHSLDPTDCNDADPNVCSTDTQCPDICGNGIDDDCDGVGDHSTPGPLGYLDDDADTITFGTDPDDCDSDTDNDLLFDDQEMLLLATDPTDPDTDNDGVSDGVEVYVNGDPSNPTDTDGDGIHNALDDDDDADFVLSAQEDVDGDGDPSNDDTDGDTIPNYLDDDDDQDFVLTANEDVNASGNRFDDDTDGDGIPNFLDNDDDGDSLRTRFEDVDLDGDPRNDDSDGDGVPDYLDDDDDDDGVDSSGEDVNTNGNLLDDDTDGDGIPNYRDPDDDGDLIDTVVEDGVAAGPDRDSDGIPNYLDPDSDNDGFSDLVETDADSDGDGTPDFVDLDSDDDTVLDANEIDADNDGDGLADRIDSDDDDDCIPTSVEEAEVVGDGDPFPNYLDTDSDNDGWSDEHEFCLSLGLGGADEDGDGDANFVDTDSDNDTIPDALEEGTELAPGDTDLDGIENRVDPDDDGDNIDTRDEDYNGDGNTGNDDCDGDGVANYLDNDDDDDLVPTVFESPDANTDPLDDDTDGDAIPDYCDADDDGDGIPTALEDVDGNGDPRNDNTDPDLIPNYLDNDDDNDTIPTLTEISETSTDFDGDLIPNHLDTDSDNDGWTDEEEWTVDTPPFDHDGDGASDYIDLDSDDDLVPDLDERHADSDADGALDRIDADDDGDTILTRNESESAQEGTGTIDPQAYDWDGDALPNYLDSDDDDDDIPTVSEIGPFPQPAGGNQQNTDGVDNPDFLDTDDDNDGELTVSEDPNGNGLPLDDDTDSDGIPNPQDPDDDGDGIPTQVEASAASRDFDGDGDENHLDIDSDDDGWVDAHEYTVGPYRPDFDGDGADDYVDFDSDNDNVLDIDEQGDSTSPIDTDLDGDEDRVDPDDDDDFIRTDQEEPLSADGDPRNDDVDGDGIPNYLDDDDDGDTVLTRLEDVNGNFDPRDDNTDEAYPLGGDIIPDYLDADDDNDKLLTIDEDVDLSGTAFDDDTDGNGRPNYLDFDDDGDSLFTEQETEQFSQGTGSNDPRLFDFDSDGTPNYLDFDDDADGVDTVCEVLALSVQNAHLQPDVDLDTIPDGVEWTNFLPADLPAADRLDRFGGQTGSGCFDPWDRDGDGDINANDPDDDGDGLLTFDEGTQDNDCVSATVPIPVGDGIPNYLDYDSDGDWDRDDPYAPQLYDDVNGDGVSLGDGLGDADQDGIFDYIDCDNTGCAGDSDQDGVLNCDEALFCPIDPRLPDDVWCATNPDSDGDGVIDGVEFGLGATPQDTDGDSIIDILDDDDDGDGFPTQTEVGMDCPTGQELTSVFKLVGEYWTFACVIPGQAANVEDCETPSNPTPCPFDLGSNMIVDYPNTDAATGDTYPLEPDEIPDYADADDDGDGRLSGVEGDDDEDGDGIVNYLDPNDFDGDLADADGDGMSNAEEVGLGLDPYRPDSDGDGVTDDLEIGDPANPRDSDGDGAIDALDDDDDGDGLPTEVEGNWDVDGDGVPNHLDDDSDGDGVPDGVQGDAEGLDDVDCDNVPDFIDAIDTDGPCAQPEDSGPKGPGGDTGCGCTSAPAPGMGWLLLPLLAVATRRRSA